MTAFLRHVACALLALSASSGRPRTRGLIDRRWSHRARCTIDYTSGGTERSGAERSSGSSKHVVVPSTRPAVCARPYALSFVFARRMFTGVPRVQPADKDPAIATVTMGEEVPRRATHVDHAITVKSRASRAHSDHYHHYRPRRHRHRRCHSAGLNRRSWRVLLDCCCWWWIVVVVVVKHQHYGRDGAQTRNRGAGGRASARGAPRDFPLLRGGKRLSLP